jgi:dihydrofolate reductase
MGKVIIDISTSLDGFIAQTNDDPGAIQDWLFKGDEVSRHSELFKTAGKSTEVLDESFRTTGALIAGKRTYDLTGGWGGSHPMRGVPMFVLAHEAPREVPQGTTPFIFVTDGIGSAVEQAKRSAGERNVCVMGGANVIQQCLEAGLADELQIHVAAVVLGEGIRLIQHMKSGPVILQQLAAIAAPGVTHVRYRAGRR